MAGYGIECSLKALLQHQGIEYPKKGRQGHDLKNLWRSSPFQFSDLQDDRGTQTFFLEQWNTDLRYESSLPVSLGLEVKELMEGAKKLQGWIQTQIRRGKFRKRK